MSRLPTFPNTPPTVQLPPVSPSGGVSQQPPSLRFPHQVEAAENAVFSVVDGASKRPGTWFVRDMTALLTGDDYRLHAIKRDADEEYLVVYGDTGGTMSLYAEEIGGFNYPAFVSVTAAAQAYLDSGGPAAGDVRMITIADYTLIINTLVETSTGASAAFNVERSWRDYDVLLSFTTADGYYFRTEKDSATQPRGYWRYKQDGITFAHINLDTVSGLWNNVSATSFWKLATGNPNGFKISFGRFGPFTISGGAATWTSTSATAGTLNKTGAWTDYDFRPGDHCFIGTDVADTNGALRKLKVGWYRISAATANALTLIIPSVSGTDCVPLSTEVYKDYAGSDVVQAYIGNEYEVIVDFTLLQIDDLQDIALAYQRAIRAAGATDACVECYGRGAYLAMQITAPYRGSNASIYLPKGSANVLGGVGGAGDWTQSGYPFKVTSPSGQVFNGSGTVDNAVDMLAPEERWTRVAAPSQSGAALDPDTMPVKMVRTSPSAGFSYTNSAANPTVVTAAGHGVRTGQTVVFVSSSSTPSIAGSRTATRIDDDTFSVPVNVTVGGSGSFRRGAVFDVDVIDWNDRTSGDTSTNPAPGLITSGTGLVDAAILQDRLMLFGGPQIAGSQTGDLFNFYSEDFSAKSESDPLDLTISSARIAAIEYAVPFRTGLTIFTLSGQQFDLSASDALTPTTARVTPTTAYNTRRARPCADGTELYFAGQAGCYTQLYEYRYDDTALSSNAANVSAHVPTYLPEDVRSLVCSANDRTVLVVPEVSNTIYVYRSFFSSGNTKQQSAWGKHVFDANYDIEDAVMLGDRCYLLTSTANIRFIERLPLFEQPDACHYDDINTTLFSVGFSAPYVIHLDRKFYLAAGSGVYSGGKTTWNLGVQTPASTVNRIVRLDTGREYTVTGWTGTSIELSGVDLSAVAVVAGCAYTFSMTLSRAYQPAEPGGPRLDLDSLVTRLDLSLVNTGDCTVTVESSIPNTPDKTTTYSAATGAPPAGKDMIVRAIGKSSALTVTVSSATARPITVSSIQWTVQPAQGLR